MNGGVKKLSIKVHELYELDPKPKDLAVSRLHIL